MASESFRHPACIRSFMLDLRDCLKSIIHRAEVVATKKMRTIKSQSQ